MSHRLRLWIRDGRRKGCRWHWLGLKEVLSLFSVTKLSAWHLERYCLPLICNCHLQVYLQHLLGDFVRSGGCWAAGEDCPASPGTRSCFLCQHTVMLTDVTRKQTVAFVAQAHSEGETWIPEGRVSINAQGSCSGWSSHCVFLTSTLGVLSKGICEWGGKTGLF